MKSYTRFLTILFCLFFVSCHKADEKEIEISRFNRNNTFLLEEFDRRQQVINCVYGNNTYIITFSDGFTYSISNEIYPVLSIGDDNCWSISGYSSNIPVSYNEEGDFDIPHLSVEASGFWSIDGTSTSMSADFFINLTQKSSIPKRHLLGLICIQNRQLVFLLSDNTSYCLSVIKDDYYIVPSYYHTHLLEKEVLAEKSISESNDNFTSFIFFSDSHWYNNYQHSPSIIRHIAEFSGIDKVFFGGDVINKHETDPAIALQEGLDFQKAFSFLGNQFYCVYGNHDNNSDGQEKKTESHLTEDQVATYLQSQMTNLGKKDGYNFYFDEVSSKTRYIGLDTGRYYRNNSSVAAIPTARFLIEALQTVPEGWHIIVISHIVMSTKKADGERVYYVPGFYKFTLQIVDDYNLRQTGSYSYNKGKITYDFTNCGGRVELCLGGHIHIDGLLYSETGIPVITVPTDSRNSSSQNIKKGTITEQSVSIVVVDYSSNKVSLFSVGRGTDREIFLR